MRHSFRSARRYITGIIGNLIMYFYYSNLVVFLKLLHLHDSVWVMTSEAWYFAWKLNVNDINLKHIIRSMRFFVVTVLTEIITLWKMKSM